MIGLGVVWGGGGGGGSRRVVWGGWGGGEVGVVGGIRGGDDRDRRCHSTCCFRGVMVLLVFV